MSENSRSVSANRGMVRAFSQESIGRMSRAIISPLQHKRVTMFSPPPKMTDSMVPESIVNKGLRRSINVVPNMNKSNERRKFSGAGFHATTKDDVRVLSVKRTMGVG